MLGSKNTDYKITNHIHMKRKSFLLALFVLSSLTLSSLYGMSFTGPSFAPPKEAHAAASDLLTGWMWSDNIGWISMSCENQGTCSTVDYGVRQDNSGNWTGYAWSSNVGWLQFNAGCPSGQPGQCSAKLTGNELRGWAKFINADNSTGWDGWLSLSSKDSTSGFAYGPTGDPESGGVNGFAWGSSVVGWTEMQNIKFGIGGGSVLTLVPTLTRPANGGGLSSFSDELQYPTSSSGAIWLSYNKNNATINYSSCTTSSNFNAQTWSTGTAVQASDILYEPQFVARNDIIYYPDISGADQTYTLSCTRTTGEIDVATATVKPLATPDACTVTLSGGGQYCPVGSAYPDTATVSWFPNNNDPTACELFGPSGLIGSFASPQNKKTSQNVTQAGNYYVQCTSAVDASICGSNTETISYYPVNAVQCQTAEICGNGIDDDGNGVIDEGCLGGPGGELCNNSIDDDGDGLINEGCGKIKVIEN